MLLSKLDEMSVGPFWLLRTRSETPVAETQPKESCPVCKEAWLQSIDKNSSIIVVLASPLKDETQYKLMKNCLVAANWYDPSIISLHELCSADMTAALAGLNEQVITQSPEHLVVFGATTAQLMNPEFIPGKVHCFANTRLLVTHHPAEMIANPLLKARVWADLCLAFSGESNE